MRQVPVKVRVAPATLQELRAIGNVEHRTVSQLVRLAIAMLLADRARKDRSR